MKKPAILSKAIIREQESKARFVYDHNLDLNVIEVDGQKILFIDSSKNNLEGQTLTKVSREGDDNEFMINELSTKTEVARERDDEENNLLLELNTKTYVVRERDDEDGFIID